MIRSLLLASAAITLSAAPAFAAPAHKAAVGTAALPASNAFSKPSTLPFQAPAFARIKDSDYEPAFLAGILAGRSLEEQ